MFVCFFPLNVDKNMEGLDLKWICLKPFIFVQNDLADRKISLK